MKLRNLVIAALAAGSLAGASVAIAAPGPNGHNDFGLCKAYFAGSQNGRDHKQNAAPFAALVALAEANESSSGDDETSPSMQQEQDNDVQEYCAKATPGGK